MTFPGTDLALEPTGRSSSVAQPADSAEVAVGPFQIGNFELWNCHTSEVSDSRPASVGCGTPKGTVPGSVPIAVGDGFAPPRCPQVVCTGKVPAVIFTMDLT